MSSRLHGPANFPIFDPAPIRGQRKIRIPGSTGLPGGGTTGQVLTKDSNDDHDVSWQDAAGGPGGGVTEAQFGFGGLIAPSAEAKSAPYMMSAGHTFTQVIVTLSAASASSYTIIIYVDGSPVDSFTVAAGVGEPNNEHVETVSIAVTANQVVQASVGAAPLGTGENLLVVCR